MSPSLSQVQKVVSTHRLRPIDTHLALYTMLYKNSAKNRYAEPVINKTKQISKIRDEYVLSFRIKVKDM